MLDQKVYSRRLGRRATRWLVRVAAAGTIVAALAYIPYRVCGSDGYLHYENLQGERALLEQSNAKLAAGNSALRSEIRRLKTDPDAVATVARDELGMVAPGEIVLRIAPAAAGAAKAPAR